MKHNLPTAALSVIGDNGWIPVCAEHVKIRMNANNLAGQYTDVRYNETGDSCVDCIAAEARKADEAPKPRRKK